MFQAFLSVYDFEVSKKNYFSHIKVVTWLEETKKKTNQVLIQHETMELLGLFGMICSQEELFN